MDRTVLTPVDHAGNGHHPGERLRRLRERRRRSRRRRIALLVIAAIALLLVLSVAPALSARTHLLEGRDLIAQGADLLLEGRGDEAAEAFGRAGEAFDAAEGAAAHPALTVQSWIPFAGRTADAVRGIARAGSSAAEAGALGAEGVADLAGGLGALAPSGGRLPLEALTELRPAVEAGRARLEEAERVVRGLSTGFVLGPVADAVRDAQAEIADVLPAARSADGLLAALPAFAGADGEERRYFVAAQNPAEARGTGGLIGAFSILTIRDGEIALEPFRDIRALRDVPVDRAPWPSEGFREVYEPFNAAGFWRSTNVPPDVAVAASSIERLYEATEGVELDGTLFVDPQALAELLEATGPVASPALGRRLTADTFVPFVTKEAYFLYGDQARRKEALGVAARAVLRRFLAGTDDPAAAVRALIDAGGGGHLILHSADPEIQRAFEQAGVAGRFGPEAGQDFFALVKNQTAGTKIDAYVTRRIRYEVALGPDGAGTAFASVELENGAPADAEPSYALGPYGGELEAFDLAPGEDFTRIAFYCPAGCRVSRVLIDGEVAGLEPYRDEGLRMSATTVRVPAQTTKRFELTEDLPRAWEGDPAGGVYRLRLQEPPTVLPTTATVVVRAPDGMRITWTNEPMEVEGGVATWTGEPGRVQDLEVRFGRSLLPGLWARLMDLLSRPVFEF